MDNTRTDTPDDLKTPLMTRGSLDIFDINILPQRHRRRKLRLVAVLPWLILIFLISSLYPSIQLALEAQKAFTEKRSELVTAQAEFTINQNNSNALTEVQEKIDSALERRDQILESYGGIQLEGSAWNSTLNEIYQMTPDGVSWNLIAQSNTEIQLEGIVNRYQTVLDLNQELNNLIGIEKAEIDSIQQIINEETLEVVVIPEGEDAVPDLGPPKTYIFRIAATVSGEELP